LPVNGGGPISEGLQAIIPTTVLVWSKPFKVGGSIRRNPPYTHHENWGERTTDKGFYRKRKALAPKR